MTKRLVWIRGLRGPEPQVWDEETDLNGAGKKSGKILADHPLPPAHAVLGLGVLSRMYPPPAEELP